MKSLLKLTTVIAVALAANACSKNGAKAPEQSLSSDQPATPEVTSEEKEKLSAEMKVDTVTNREGYFHQVKVLIPNGEGSGQTEYSVVLVDDLSLKTNYVPMKYKGEADGSTFLSTFGTQAKALSVVHYSNPDSGEEGKAFVFLKLEDGSYALQFEADLNKDFTKEDLVADFVKAASSQKITVNELLALNAGEDAKKVLAGQEEPVENKENVKSQEVTLHTGPR